MTDAAGDSPTMSPTDAADPPGRRPTRFRDWNAPSSYRSDRDDVVADLFEPALIGARSYWRASGYFSSSVFRALSRGFSTFFAHGGRMSLVTSPHLSRRDVEAVGRGLVDRDVNDLPSTIEEVFRSLDDRRVSCSDVLRYLLHAGSLTVTVAFTKGKGHAIYHEKFSIFEDDDRSGLLVAGSANESENALLNNFERGDVWRSWMSSDERRQVDRGRDQFSRLLAGMTDNLETVALFRAYLDGRLKVTDAEGWTPRRLDVAEHRSASMEEALIPSSRALYPHQRQAIRAWASSGGNAVLAMATGSGKTVTALSAASQVFDRMQDKRLALLIVAPYVHLVDQWRANAREFGLNPIRCAEGSGAWDDELDAAVSALNSGARRVVSIATTPQTMRGDAFKGALARLRRPLMVIGDEAHNYGSPAFAAALPPTASLRIGLSATPERWLDPEGTAAVKAYFGETAFEYSLADAIRDGVLTPYRYHPVIVSLAPDERDAYLELTAKLGRFAFTGEEDELPDAAKRLMVRRARLVASAREKLPRLKSLLAKDTRARHVLVYCGDGVVDGSESVVRQVDEVVRIVGEELGMTCARYTHETSPERRREHLEAFAEGAIQVLVAIRCLDEGVDIPSTRAAYILASSGNPRQFIQRRGRVLRLSPRTGKTVADVFDFFVTPPSPEPGEEVGGVHDAMRRMFARQISRAAEFSTLAINGPTARAPLIEVSQKLNVLEEWWNDSKRT